jgi:hypothetical protein
MVKKKILSNDAISSGPRWFDDNCLKLKREARKALRELRNSPSGNDAHFCARKHYLDWKRTYANLLDAKRKKFMTNIHLKLTDARNAYKFYQALSFFRPKFDSFSGVEHFKPIYILILHLIIKSILKGTLTLS